MKLSRRILFFVIMGILFFGLAAGGYYLTRGKVLANEEKKKEQAFDVVYPDAASFDEASYRTEYLTRFLEENGYGDDQVYVNKVTFARNEIRDVTGIVVQVSSYKKYGGIITMLAGIRNDGTVNAVSILSISDAKGLDFKVRDPEFCDQFAGKRVDAFRLVSFVSEDPEDIIAANGAEDASQSMVNAVNAAILTNRFIDEYFGETLG